MSTIAVTLKKRSICDRIRIYILSFMSSIQAVEETIRICQDENVLKEYLARQREEIMDIMMTLFDEETLMKNHDASVERKARRQGEATGRIKGIKEGREEMTALMGFLAQNGRTEDIIKASADEGYLDRLLNEFQSSGVVTG